MDGLQEVPPANLLAATAILEALFPLVAPLFIPAALQQPLSPLQRISYYAWVQPLRYYNSLQVSYQTVRQHCAGQL